MFIVLAAMLFLVNCVYAADGTSRQDTTKIIQSYDLFGYAKDNGTQDFTSVTTSTYNGVTTQSTFKSLTYMKSYGGISLSDHSVGTTESKNLATGAITATGTNYRQNAYQRGILTGCDSSSSSSQYKETESGLVLTRTSDTTDTNSINKGMVSTDYSYTSAHTWGTDDSGGAVETEWTETNQYNDHAWIAGNFVTTHEYSDSRMQGVGSNAWSLSTRDVTNVFGASGELEAPYMTVKMSFVGQSLDSGTLQPTQYLSNYKYHAEKGPNGAVITFDESTYTTGDVRVTVGTAV